MTNIVRLNELPDGSGSLTNDDIFVFMDDPASGRITKKISLTEISSAIGAGAPPSGVTLYDITLNGYNEATASPAISSNTLTLDLSSAQTFTVNLNSNITTFTISNTPSGTNTSIGFTLFFTADGTARVVTWPVSIKWAGNAPPTVSSTLNKTDIFSFVSTDNGTSWYGFVGGQAF